ncbi:hypothetical protein MNBD_GAMMA06-941 [hydrothermal vent metagenome]|uniref:Peptidase S8/S53 domain-containing protein n=1 Tax=hydrothermal vent metagenome TaxID=652676 RepID=A0A3B0WFX3_9ZZZZ
MTQNLHRAKLSVKLITGLMAFITVAGLVSCGGSGGATNYSVGGAVTGLQESITLRNNADVLALNRDGRYSFNNRLNSGDVYNVSIQRQPDNQTCEIINATGTVATANVTNIIVSCLNGVTLSGRYQAVPLIQVDSDVNDVTAKLNVSNDSFFEAQVIPNFSTVHGFVTEQGTGRFGDGDRFAGDADKRDFYSVDLQVNQTIRLQVADFSGVDVFQGNLYLMLYDSAGAMIGLSDLSKEFENIVVPAPGPDAPADGKYFIVVEAFSGSSKYTLSLNVVTPANILRQSSVDFRPGESIVQFKPNATVNNIQASSQSSNQLGNQPNNPQITFSHHQTTRATLASFDVANINSASALSSGLNSRGLKAAPNFIDELKQKNFASYQKYQTLQQIKRLNQRADVVFAEPNYIYKALRVPNDEFYNLQWHYPAINLPQAWDITTGAITEGSRAGGDVIVAVVDTGVFLAHPEFSGQLVSGYDFISDVTNANDENGIDNNPDDPGDGAQLSSSSWHGTHVAGTVAAKSDNNTDVASVAWQAKIMPLRVLGTLGGSSFDIIQAIRYAAGLSNSSNTLPAQKADIINLSLGGSGFSQASQNAYNAVRSAGVIVVAAAGNENSSQFSYPASYDGVVSVSATDFADNRAPYSNFGSRVDVAAPGGNQGVDLNNDNFGDGVLSTLVDDSSGSRVDALRFYQGTSMASPHVAGVFALMRAVYPELSPDEVDTLLATGSITTDLGAAGRDDIYGNGLIDALKAVQEALKLSGGEDLPVLPAFIAADPSQLAIGTNLGGILQLSNKGDDPASITGVVADAGWLSVAEGTVDGNNLGEYLVSVDRTGLSDSSYLGTIVFSLSTGATLNVQVSMDVGQIDKTGNAGTIYMLLLDENNNAINQASTIDNGDGTYDYRFDNVIAGTYGIVGGSDIDNDLFICQLAEACGGYPILNTLSTIDVSDSDITGLDFVVDILANFGANVSSTKNNITTTGIKRPVDKLIEQPLNNDNKQLQ